MRKLNNIYVFHDWVDFVKNGLDLFERNCFVFEVSNKEFVDIFKVNYQNRLKTWYKNYCDKLKKLSDQETFEFTYAKDFMIDPTSDPVKSHIYDWSKYYFFMTSGLKTYRVPLGVIKDTAIPDTPNRCMIHPGNARLNCMCKWEDDYRIRLMVSDCNLGEYITKLAKVSSVIYNFRDPNDQGDLVKYLEMYNWEAITMKVSENGYELTEMHPRTKDFNKEFTISFNYKEVIVNDKKILFVNDEGIPELIHYK